MFTVLSARAPRWADLAHTSITLMVLFEETKDTYGEMPFAASPDDSEPHGVELYQRALAGEFGEVLEPTLEMVQAQVMCQRGVLSASATAKINELAASLETLEDAVRLKMATGDQVAALPAVSAELNAWRLFRVQLAQLDGVSGYPMSFDWPQPPAQPFVYVPSSDTDELPVQGVSPDELPKT
jgi:hypothetical protein